MTTTIYTTFLTVVYLRARDIQVPGDVRQEVQSMYIKFNFYTMTLIYTQV